MFQNTVRLNKTLLSTYLRSIALHRTISANNDNFKGKYDVIIAGGGMVGCTLACSLGKNSLFSNLKILLLEGSPNKHFQLKNEYSNRVSALNQNTKSLMNSLKIWQHVENMRLQPVRHMQVWDACSDALITFNSSEIMDDDVAYIVENDVLLHAVNTELNSSDVSNVNIVYGAKIADYELNKSGDSNAESLVKMSNGDVYSCQLLIGADGANSAVRKAMGVQYLSWNYDQMGVVATLELAEETENTTAWQRFLPSGPVALLPLESKRSSLVWSTSPGHAKELLALPEEQFVDALNEALWKQYPRNNVVDAGMSWLGSGLRQLGLADGISRQLPPSICAVAANTRAAFPLGFGHSTRYVAPGVALLGDAAHRVHPLAGQGVNLGFGDVKHLTQFLGDAVYQGLDISEGYMFVPFGVETLGPWGPGARRLYKEISSPLIGAFGDPRAGAYFGQRISLAIERADHSWLEKYESARQKHNIPTQLAIEAIHRLYSVDLPPFVLARSLGLQLTNALQPIKKLIMAHAVAT